MVDGQLVARQQAYVHTFMQEEYYEVKHYYCPSCGTAWGLRVDPEAQSPRHHYYSKRCKECGGDESMLNPWEWMHLHVLGPNVLAYLILTLTQEVDHEIPSNSLS